MKKYLGWIILVIGVVLDQTTKIFAQKITADIVVIKGLLNFTKVYNNGSAFGMFQNTNGILAAISALVCIGILCYIFYGEKKRLDISLGAYLILSGGIGNLIDRAIRGFVVDFIDTPFIATFNIADSLVVIGCIWIIAEELCRNIFQKRKE